MSMMRSRDVEWGLAQLDREDEQEADERRPNQSDDRHIQLERISHVERVGCHEEAHGHEQNHRFVRHDLERLAPSADLGIRATRAVRGHDEEQSSHRDDKSAHEQIAAAEEDSTGKCSEDECAGHVDTVDAADRNVILVDEFADVVIRLEKQKFLCRKEH